MTGRTTQASQENSASYSQMATGDVEAIGAHCQMPFCHQLDFLPFRCESCKGKFCLDHRSETSHQCPRAGEWARRRADANRSSTTSTLPSKPTILSHEQQCAEPSCKTLINTPLVTGVQCDKCNRSYCLKHRFTYEHDCSNLVPLGARSSGASSGPTQREKGLAALEKLRAWGAAKKSSASASMPRLPESKKQQSASARAAALSSLKKTAKGDEKVPADKRVYVYVEAAADRGVTAKIPKGTFFYNSEFSIGRVLDLAAKSLQVANLNNRAEGEEEKLRVFHVEGGRLLDFGEKLGQGVQTGNTIVLLRGVGAGMAKTPEKTS